MAVCVIALGNRAGAQAIPASRVNVLVAEDRRAPTGRDLETLRAGARGSDPQTARVAVRALGRLERPDLIAEILTALRHPIAEVRAEAANALAQALRGWAPGAPRRPQAAGRSAAVATSPESVQTALVARLEDEDDPSVRAAICESLGRLPSRSAELIDRAEAALVGQLQAVDSITDRLGVAKALEAFVRITREVRPPGSAVSAALKTLAVVRPSAPADLPAPAGRPRFEADPLRDARVRRLALEALILLDAVDAEVVHRAESDPDSQVRQLAMKAALLLKPPVSAIPIFVRGLEDATAMVRLEALKGIRERGGDETCAVSLASLGDRDAHISLVALDQLSSCGSWREAVTRLEDAITDLSAVNSPRGWHRAAHAGVALAFAQPERAAALLGHLAGSNIWQLRMYAARAATILKDRVRLAALARDANDNVVEAAIEGLRAVSGHDSDALYVAALSRTGYQAVRMAALALDGSPDPAAASALKAALDRLVDEGRANSLDARRAIVDALSHGDASRSAESPSANRRANSLAAALMPEPKGPTAKPPDLLNGDDLRRLASPRARVTIAGVGAFELALFPAEAPATVMQFVSLAESGYYNGLTFHRVLANFVIQGGSPGANEYVGYPSYMRDEVGLWPHVRGAVGISTRGRDTGDAQIFIDLVDNPRLDHQYTVFAQVLNGMDMVDRILEGDVIEKIEIIP
jgi:cyclophilin family peptidyl-prolyl cis-trans isomerase